MISVEPLNQYQLSQLKRMAKELPYFRFEPSEWDNGNIQICSRESKGLFIDLCSIYWSRLGELPYALALQKLCNGNKDALQELVDAEILGVIEGQIVIEFLDEQLSERGQVSEKRRNAAKKRWSDANALQVESKSNAKRREENIKEEKKKEESKTLEWFVNQIDEIYLENLKYTHKGKDIQQAVKEAYAHIASDSLRLKNLDGAGAKKLLNTWLANTKIQSNGKSKGLDVKSEIQSIYNRNQ